MADKLERLYEYRSLVAKRESLRLPLPPEEAARFETLHRQLREGVPQVDDADPYTLVTEPWHVDVATGGRLFEGTVPNASGAGIAIEAPNAPALGENVVATVRHSRHGIEFSFPGRVVWRVAASFGIAFSGVPTESRIGGRRSGVYRSDDTPTETPKRERHSA